MTHFDSLLTVLVKENLASAVTNGFEGELRGLSAQEIVNDMAECGSIPNKERALAVALQVVGNWLTTS